jgi:hypothetical protein
MNNKSIRRSGFGWFVDKAFLAGEIRGASASHRGKVGWDSILPVLNCRFVALVRFCKRGRSGPLVFS